MAERLPAGADIRFIRTIGTGTVHLLVLPPDPGPTVEPDEAIPMDGSGQALAGLLGTPTITRCGQHTFPYAPNADARHGFTWRFIDDQLCAACYRTLHPDDQGRAFDHPQPDDEDDNEPAAA
jgi:hypothetical protein